MIRELQNVRLDNDLKAGAFNAVRVCLRLQRDERVTIITDRETNEIAAALVREVETTGAPHALFVLEDFSERPLNAMPQAILDDLAKSQVSVFAAQARVGELASRIQMTAVVNRHRIRHAHMVNINKQIMMQGMRADFESIDRHSTLLVEKARQTKRIRAQSSGGTDVTADFSPRLKWVKTSGIISPDKWGNLPGGEIFTAPENVNGIFVVDGVVGDYLCQIYGDLSKSPLTIEILDNRIKSLRCSNQKLLEDFRAYTRTDENSNRVGEFAIGTNTALTGVIGHILQDEKLPGIHIAFGHPYAEHTGQNWISTTHIDCVGRDFDIWMDEEKIMERGKFLV
jgi:leucyl aminopeptidase (aminopeptidase T)